MADPQLVDALFKSGAPMCAAQGEVIFKEGEPADGAYLIASGRVSLSFATDRGDILCSHIAGPGAILGLAPAVATLPQVFTALVLEDAVMSFISCDALRTLVSDHANLGVELVCVISAEEAAIREQWAHRLRKRSTPGG